MHDGIVAYRIPDDKREEYFEWVDVMQSACKLGGTDSENYWNTHNDPIIVIDRTFFKPNQWFAIVLFMAKIGAKNVTEAYVN